MAAGHQRVHGQRQFLARGHAQQRGVVANAKRRRRPAGRAREELADDVEFAEHENATG
jgi:hypothetical protein